MGNKNFTKEEKQLITLFDKINWVARDGNGELYGFKNKPFKEFRFNSWILEDGDEYSAVPISLGFDDFNPSTSKYEQIEAFTNISFRDIQWEDDEPTSREEILEEK